ncbi:D-2-hydroxyacid dehydrogenase [Chloroflexota bacterium]
MLEKSVRVLVTSPIGENCLGQISKVSQRLEVLDVSNLLPIEQNRGHVPNGELDTLLADTEVIFGFDVPQNLIKRAPKLKWIQTISAGVDHLMIDDVLGSQVIITTIKGLSSTSVAEFVFGLALIMVKQLSLCFQLKQTKQWQKYRTATLQSKTMGIVGHGYIGREVSRLAKAFGMRVLATRRSIEQTTHIGNSDIILPKDRLCQLLTESDFVVVSVPLTPETNRLIGGKELRTMKSTAYLINIARGNVIDEGALIKALEEGWIAGAGLDVFAEEPLPSNSRLWELPNVIFSPHVSGDTEDEFEMATELFMRNLKHYLDGISLLNLVDKNKMY